LAKNLFGVLEDFFIRKTKDLATESFQVGVSLLVVFY